jgi:TATA-box binding protein (TBP) (component of TFIID and TFIIIB)
LKLIFKGLFLIFKGRMDHLRVSTITAISQINDLINLKNIYEKVPIDNYITFIEYGSDNPPRGFSKKLLKKTRKNKTRKIFYNQITLHVFKDQKIINVKLFNNGKIQMTGLKYESQGFDLLHDLINHFKQLYIFRDEIKMVHYDIVLINSDFDIGFEIDRETLHSHIINSGIYSSYEPCMYPGVNVKYFINQNQSNGICNCNIMCNGKGKGHGDGDCKKITVAIFKSGKIIITGGQNKGQIVIAYNFIKDFIHNDPESYKLIKEND